MNRAACEAEMDFFPSRCVILSDLGNEDALLLACIDRCTKNPSGSLTFFFCYTLTRKKEEKKKSEAR